MGAIWFTFSVIFAPLQIFWDQNVKEKLFLKDKIWNNFEFLKMSSDEEVSFGLIGKFAI